MARPSRLIIFLDDGRSTAFGLRSTSTLKINGDNEKKKTYLNQKLVYFALGVMLTIAILLSYFVIQSSKSSDHAMGRQSDYDNLQNQENNESIPTVVAPDSTQVTDNHSISMINGFFDIYSKCNYDGNVEKYLELFHDPAFMNKKMMNKDAIRKMVSKFFMENSTINHFFQDIVAYSKSNGEFIVYLKEHQETIKHSNSKPTNVTAYKRFVLVGGPDNLVCKEMKVISTSYN